MAISKSDLHDLGDLRDSMRKQRRYYYVRLLDRVIMEASLEVPSLPAGDGLTDEQRTKVRDAITEALGDAYDCLRVWSAWGVGTMRPDDFALVAEDDSRLDEITDAAINAILAARREPGEMGAGVSEIKPIRCIGCGETKNLDLPWKHSSAATCKECGCTWIPFACGQGERPSTEGETE